MDSNRFYHIRPLDKKDCVRLASPVSYDPLKVIGQTTPLKTHLTFTIATGTIFNDILQFNDSLNFAISEKIKLVLEDNSFTGWSCFPITVQNAKVNYYVFQVLSEAGPITNLDALNNYETERVEFDNTTWNHSDIFTLKETLLYVITNRVRDALLKANASNLEVLPL